MILEELKLKMESINKQYWDDAEVCHSEIDRLLLEYIGDEVVRQLFAVVTKWYA